MKLDVMENGVPNKIGCYEVPNIHVGPFGHSEPLSTH